MNNWVQPQNLNNQVNLKKIQTMNMILDIKR
jgi:hypothetical protein